jgi:ATP-dependent helicase/nuclease subunit A
MTRAKELLVLSATAAHRPAPGSSARARVLAACGEAAEVGATPEANGAEATAAPVASRIELLELPRLATPRRTSFPAADVAPTADELSAQLGRAVHRVLEWQSRANAPRDLPASAVAAAAEFGLPADAATRVAALASDVLGSADCAAFFDPDRVAWAGNEVAIGWRGQVLRIDRLVALHEPEGEVWWVLDYKLRHDPEAVPAYLEQLATYRDAVRAQRPGAVVRAAFITGQGGLVEPAA